MPEFVCECGAKKGSEDALKSHICIKHLQWIPYECVHCSANQQGTREATEHKMRLHIHEIHPGKEQEYIFRGDSHKEQLLKCRMEQAKNYAMDRNNAKSSHQISTGSTEIAANRMKTEVITFDDEDDSKPQSPPVDHRLSHHVQAAADTQPTHQTPSVVETTGLMDVHRAANSMVHQPPKIAEAEGDINQLIDADEQEEMKPQTYDDSDDSGDDFEPSTPPSKSPIPEPEVKPELIVGDDDDFKPDPPASNMADSQSQQQHVGGCSAEDAMGSGDSDGSSPQQPTSSATKRSKLKRNKKLKKAQGSPKRLMKSKSTKDHGYCVTCKRHFAAIRQHLSAKLSSPVFECSKCDYSSFKKWHIEKHITRMCGSGAKVVRLRSKMNVAGEMRKLSEIHLGAAPCDWPYRCGECKVGISNVPHHILKHHLKVEKYECPVCGWSGDFTPIRTHMQQKHPSCNTRPINNEAKYRDQIRVIQKGIIVRK